MRKLLYLQMFIFYETSFPFVKKATQSVLPSISVFQDISSPQVIVPTSPSRIADFPTNVTLDSTSNEVLAGTSPAIPLPDLGPPIA